MRYRLYDKDEAAEAGLPAPWGEGWDGYWEEGQLFLYKGTEFIACDGGEPEDNSFARDWGWVVDELNKAYQEGYKQAQEDCY